MEFILSLTYRCNLMCSMCTQYGEGFKNFAPKDLPVEEWENFFQSVADVTPKPKMLLMGGEPLLYEDFDRLFDLTQKYGFNVQIVTNGVLLDKYLDRISKTDTTITISLDGLCSTHDKIRNKPGTFDKVMQNIEKINRLQNSGSRIKLNINCVMLPDNADELADFLSFIQEKNIEILTFQHLQFSSEKLNNITEKEWELLLNKSYGGGLIPPKKYKIDEEYLQKLKLAIKNLKKICKTKAFIFPALEDDEIENYYLEKNLKEIRPGRICTTPWINPTIHSNGDVSNCIGNIIGNITQNDFWEIWNNEKASKLREALCSNGKFTLCAKCCNFYKGNFIYAPNALLSVNGKQLLLPDELNYVHSSKDGVFIKDYTRKADISAVPVVPAEVFTKEIFNKIKNNETIIAEFKDIKEKVYENRQN